MPKVLYILITYAIVMFGLSITSIAELIANSSSYGWWGLLYVIAYPLLTAGIVLRKNLARQAYVAVTAILIAWTIIGALVEFFITVPSEITENISSIGLAVGMGPAILFLMVYSAIQLLLIQMATSQQIKEYTKTAI